MKKLILRNTKLWAECIFMKIIVISSILTLFALILPKTIWAATYEVNPGESIQTAVYQAGPGMVAGSDYTLIDGSPAIAAGKSVTFLLEDLGITGDTPWFPGFDFTKDKADNLWADHPSMGAYENADRIVDDTTPPVGTPTKPHIEYNWYVYLDEYGHENRAFAGIIVGWEVGTSSDHESGIAYYYLEVGTLDEPNKYFNENISNSIHHKIGENIFYYGIDVPEEANIPYDTEIYARVRAINGEGLQGEFSELSDKFEFKYIKILSPTITSIFPAYIKKRTSTEIIIKGEDFENDAQVSCMVQGITMGEPNVIDENTITIDITVSNDVAAGMITIIVLNPDGTSATNTLKITEGLAENTGQVTIQGGVKGYVNPKKGDTAKIHFKAAGAGNVEVKIYTVRGQLVWETATLTDGSEDVITWACTNTDNSIVVSGIYIVYIKGPGIKETKKIAIIK